MTSTELVEKGRKKVSAIRKAFSCKHSVKALAVLEELGEVTVTEVQYRVGLDQSYTSQILKALKDGGLVKIERRGQFIYYQIDRHGVYLLKEFLGL
jgi:DNA-binding transcriptional ArsR family regulator